MTILLLTKLVVIQQIFDNLLVQSMLVAPLLDFLSFYKLVVNSDNNYCPPISCGLTNNLSDSNANSFVDKYFVWLTEFLS